MEISRNLFPAIANDSIGCSFISTDEYVEADKGCADGIGKSPRKTRLSTPMGRKKERRAEIQRE